MKPRKPDHQRKDVTAEIRGGDPRQPMETEPEIATATLREAVFWHRIYTEILAMEEGVLERIRHLMVTQSDTAKREVELSNVPVISAQVERFRSRQGYWGRRLEELRSSMPA